MSEQDRFFDADLDDEATLVTNSFTSASVSEKKLSVHTVKDHATATSTMTPSRYHTHDLVAQGAMGRILLAQDRFLSRRVAFKEIRAELRGQAHILNGFLTEAQITAQLEHPGVIPIYTMEHHDDDSLAYTMKLVNGNTLKEEIAQLKDQLKRSKGMGSSQWQQAYRRLIELFLVVCDTLDYAHNKGIVHRDLKPSNIMIGSYNEVYVLDWGIAALQNPAPAATSTVQAVRLSLPIAPLPEGQITGTPKYMSPEQAYGRPEALRATSDLFSLGLILYELTFLHTAFQGQDMRTLLLNVRRNQQAPEVSAFPQVKAPAEMVAIIHKATRRPISQRYASVAEMSQDIRAWLNDQPTQALPDTPVRQVMRWTRHHPQQTLGIGTVILLLSALGIALSLWWSQQAVQDTRIRRQAVNQLFIATAIKASALDKELGHLEALLKMFSAQGAEAFLRGDGPLQERMQPLEAAFLRTQAMALEPDAPPQSVIIAGRLKRSPIRWSTLQYLPGVTAGTSVRTSTAPFIYPVQASFSDKQATTAHFAKLQKTFPQPRQTFRSTPQWGHLDAQYLPLYQELHTASGQAIGWSGFLLDRQAIAALLAGSQLSGLKQAWLINSSDPRQMLSLNNSTQPPQALLSLLTQKKSGYVEIKDEILAYQQLSTLPWHLVFQVDRTRLWKAASHALDS